MENWKDFEFGEMKYSISSYGRVYGYGTDNILSGTINADGYHSISLGNKKYRKSFRVHRLVAEFFIPNDNREVYNEVNHIDFDRKNNHYKNLEWCTHQENIKHSVLAGRMSFQIYDYTGENNPNYGNRKLSEIYKEDLEYAKEKQGRPGIKNGRCIPIAMYSDNFYKEFSYIGECAKYIFDSKISNGEEKSISSNLSLAISKNKKYLGFNFKKI